MTFVSTYAVGLFVQLSVRRSMVVIPRLREFCRTNLSLVIRGSSKIFAVVT
jgi:hypothetical protein